MSVDNLVLLVGSSPLPNYLAVQMLRPNTVWLIHTPETGTVKDRLVKVIEKHLPDIQLRAEPISDAGSAAGIRRVLDRLPRGSHLHYTGGTKAMGIHVYRGWWEVCDGNPSLASYLDDRTESVRIDDGSAMLLADHQIELDLQTLADLEGFKSLTVRSQESPVPHGPTLEDADILARETLTQQPDLPQKLYASLTNDQGKPRTYSDLRANPLNLHEDFKLELSVRVMPGPDWSDSQIKVWRDFLRGTWLEDWTGHLLEGLGLGTVYVGNTAIRHNGRRFETDVAVIRGHRLYLMSCTTSNGSDRCKSKFFEVGHRARQLGGDLSRFALVCLLDETKLSARELERDMEDDWLGSDSNDLARYPVFAPRSLREWLDGDTTRLETWLQQ
jgi:hypothetical protein